MNHAVPGEFRLGYILLPMGYSYNKDIQAAKKGDTLKLMGDSKGYKIFSVRKLSLRGPDADVLCRLRYGITIKGALMRWQSNARLEGHSANVISTEECLWVIYALHEDDEEEDN